jgi:hypothetical protein
VFVKQFDSAAGTWTPVGQQSDFPWTVGHLHLRLGPAEELCLAVKPIDDGYEQYRMVVFKYDGIGSWQQYTPYTPIKMTSIMFSFVVVDGKLILAFQKEPSPRPMLAVLQYDPSQSNSWTYLAGTPPYANYYSQYVFLASMPNDSLVAMYEDTGSIGVLDGSETWRSVLTAGFPSESDATLFALEGDGNSAPIAVLVPRSGSTPWL